jgi:hypothetical protein
MRLCYAQRFFLLPLFQRAAQRLRSTFVARYATARYAQRAVVLMQRNRLLRAMARSTLALRRRSARYTMRYGGERYSSSGDKTRNGAARDSARKAAAAGLARRALRRHDADVVELAIYCCRAIFHAFRWLAMPRYAIDAAAAIISISRQPPAATVYFQPRRRLPVFSCRHQRCQPPAPLLPAISRGFADADATPRFHRPLLHCHAFLFRR